MERSKLRLDRPGTVAKSFDHQGVKPEFAERLAGAGIVLSAAREPVTGEPVGQRGQQGALAEPTRPFLEVVGEEAVAADGHDPGGRRGDADRAAGTIEPRGIAGVDIVAWRLRDQGVAGRLRRGV